ncbi:LysR family transcriptional regulator [Bordetella sp. H567]|uniref:LysR family transcriptional regulator n=1 Tax=Bordetella sp. H567 TaxID=1697043 RepID=UPI00081CA7F2|nr:LysR family transcriptional regulator [Bordetella sp. H567]AOB29756.1 LysR family transcriptional regulator [Bordetella sp. H567]
MIDWEDLHVFAVFMRQRSLSAAARELQVEHATIARRIASLERDLKLKLVDRRTRSYLPTSDGETIARLGAGMEEAAHAITRVAEAGQQGVLGDVSLSAPPMLTLNLIAPRLGELRKKHPGLRLHIITETRTASLTQGEADLAIRLSRPTGSALVVRKLGSIPFWLYASPAYLEECTSADWTFLAYDESMEQSPQQVWLKAHANGRPIVLSSNHLEIQQAAAAAGAGIVGLPFFAGDRDRRLVRVDSAGPALRRDVWLIVHEDLRRVPRVVAAMEFVSNVIGDVLKDNAS